MNKTTLKIIFIIFLAVLPIIPLSLYVHNKFAVPIYIFSLSFIYDYLFRKFNLYSKNRIKLTRNNLIIIFFIVASVFILLALV